MSVKILCGDSMTELRKMPSESVHCVVTSPPYWGLRDYGVTGQLGMEPTLGEHIDAMVGVFREVRRVLRRDGTLWLNYGDCYATSPNGRSAADTKAAGNDDRTFRDKPFSTIGPIYDPLHRKGGARGNNLDARPQQEAPTGRVVSGGYLKPKDLCMVPSRLAIALQEDGWWVRSEIIWAKTAPMPESVRDRPACAHEKIFLLTRGQRYFYDGEAVKEAAVSDHPSGNGYKRNSRLSYSDANGARGNDEQWIGVGGKRNLRNVWLLGPEPYPEAHFATFPTEVPRRAILAGCPVGGTVLDPFFGAGTTGLVADRLGRDCIGIELNQDYCDLARRRLERDPQTTKGAAARQQALALEAVQ